MVNEKSAKTWTFQFIPEIVNNDMEGHKIMPICFLHEPFQHSIVSISKTTVWKLRKSTLIPQKLRETNTFISKLQYELFSRNIFIFTLWTYGTFHLQARFLLVSVPYQKVAQYFSEPFYSVFYSLLLYYKAKQHLSSL